MILRQAQTFAFLFSPWRAPPAARHPYRASGLVLAPIADIPEHLGKRSKSTRCCLLAWVTRYRRNAQMSGVALGAGIGLISVSPWSANSPSVTTFGALAAACFIAVELFACGFGGYLAGRLRRRWARVHDDEVYFRDTAHGLLVWAVGAVLTAALLAPSAVSAVSGAATGEGSSILNPTGYFADMMLRTDHPPIGDQTPTVIETRRILARALVSGELPDADKTYLVVFNRTAMSTADSEKRVTDVFSQAKGARHEAATKAKEAAEAARKSGVYAALWALVSLLVGAVSASYMAVVGGRIRDEGPSLV